MNKIKRSVIAVTSFLFLSIFLSSCASVSTVSKWSGIQEDYLTNIPKETKTIFVEKQSSADVLFEEVTQILLDRNHRIIKEDKARHYILTEGKDVGESTYQRMTLLITSKKEGISTLKITTEWKPGMMAMALASSLSKINGLQSDWLIAKWEYNRLGIAIAESVAVAHAIVNNKISYEL